MPRKPYSRLARLEAKRARRSALIYLVLTVIFAIVMLWFGFPFLTQFTSFFLNLAGSTNPIEVLDKTPPAPPLLSDLPEFTNQKQVRLSGQAEPGSSVVIELNGSSKKLLADSAGQFSTDLDLKEGENLISAIATDHAGNSSATSKILSLTYDNQPPEITVTKPQQNQQFYGSTQKSLTIEGTVDPNSTLSINDRFVVVSSQGQFTFLTALQNDSNTFSFKATDQAGNQSEFTLTVTFSP